MAARNIAVVAAAEARESRRTSKGGGIAASEDQIGDKRQRKLETNPLPVERRQRRAQRHHKKAPTETIHQIVKWTSRHRHLLCRWEHFPQQHVRPTVLPRAGVSGSHSRFARE